MRTDFENIKKGDFLYLKSEWMDAGDETITFIASEDYCGGDRLYMHDLDSTLPIIPTSLIQFYMLKAFEKQ